MSQEYAFEAVDIQAVLEEYHRKRMLENLAGPCVSLVTHLIVLTLMFVCVVTRAAPAPPAIEVSIVEEQIKEIEPEVLEEILPPEIEETTAEDQKFPPSDAQEESVGEDVSVDDFSTEAPSTDDNMDDFKVLDIVANQSSLLLDGLVGGMANRGPAPGRCSPRSSPVTW